MRADAQVAKSPGAAATTAAPVSPAASLARRGSSMTEEMVGSRILVIASDIRARIARGEQVCNLTVGDFAPSQFRIPDMLARGIEEAIRKGETNYPPANGLLALRESIRTFYRTRLGLDYPLASVLVASGARPGIYAAFRTVVDAGDRVVFGVPCWSVDNYCQLVNADPVAVECDPATGFLPTPDALAPHLRGARLLALNSPLNPAGTAFDADTLGAICDLVLEENARRVRGGQGERPLYLLYDQVYWLLTFGGTVHVNPVSLRPEMAPFTFLADAMSKPFASTGLRVGWLVGPEDLIALASDFLGHVGAWAPRAEQVATASFLNAAESVDTYMAEMRQGVQSRLNALERHFAAMRASGLPVETTSARGAIYLSARVGLSGRRTPDGVVLRSDEDVRSYLLRAAGFAVVPFQAFGVTRECGWFRLSVGAVSVAEIEAAMPRVRAAIEATSAG
ncbi:MAG TPA: aminotransferase class I/II-fold pyridoxal phosphate-dependent enzyme [Gemmatimonadaceae bacterium]|nr:aminotransferase class I/II-fold pyridoxal phosphate-dependent enzyme [Gemmatimonadaceae bacterium]